MDVKTLSDALKSISLRAGVATDEDFIGANPSDVVYSYAHALSGGRINDPQTIRDIIRDCREVSHFIHRVAKPTYPVPDLATVERVLHDSPIQAKPTAPQLSTACMQAIGGDREHAAYLSEKQMRERTTEQYKSVGDAIKMELVRRTNPDPHGERQIRSMRAAQAINRFITDYGRDEYKSLAYNDTRLHDAVMASNTPQEFMEAVEDKAVPHGT